MRKTTNFRIYSFAVLGAVLIYSASCKKSSDSGSNNSRLTTVTDKDGNIYHMVTIGTQVWMAENLKTTKYNDGNPIPLVTDAALWATASTPAYCWYNNDIGFKNTYGALYNWFTVKSGRLAPDGWHVPSADEWSTLINYLGGPFFAGGKLKEKDTLHWNYPNVGATNEAGFTALPGGYREVYTSSDFYDMGASCCFWSSSEYSADEVNDVEIYTQQATASLYGMYKTWGISVRCIKN